MLRKQELNWFGRALRELPLTCVDFGRDQICTQVDPSFSPLGHPTQVKAIRATSINLLLTNEIQDVFGLKCVFFAFCAYLWGKLRVRLATQRKSLRKFNLWLLATTYKSVWPGFNTTANRAVSQCCGETITMERAQETRITPCTNQNSKQNYTISIKRGKTCNGCQAREENALWFQFTICSGLVERKRNSVCPGLCRAT